MILLEPELEDGVDEGVGVSVSLYDVLFGQRLLIPADGLWRAKRISSVNVLCIEMAFSVGDGNQHVDLGNGETINISFKDRSIGVNEQDGLRCAAPPWPFLQATIFPIGVGKSA